MAFVNIKCLSCGCAIQMADTSGNRFCMYCGSKFQGIDEIDRIQMEDSGSEAFKKGKLIICFFRQNKKLKKLERENKLAIEKYKEQRELEKQQIAKKKEEEERAEKKFYNLSIFPWIGIPIIVIAVTIFVFAAVSSH